MAVFFLHSVLNSLVKLFFLSVVLRKICVKCFSQSTERSCSAEKPGKCKTLEKSFVRFGVLRTRERSHMPQKRCKQKLFVKMSGSPYTVHENDTSDDTIISLPASTLPEPRHNSAKALSCWTCQEERPSESQHVDHYEYRIRNSL